MKRVRNVGKMVLSLLLCCAMFNCTAFAAGPKTIQVGNVIIESGYAPTNIMPLREEHVFANGSYSCTSTRAYKVSGTCRSVNGDYLKVRITNTGDADLSIKYVVTVKGTSVPDDDILTPAKGVYESLSHTMDGTGLDCTFTLEITSNSRNKTGNFDVYVSQYWS